MVRKVHKPKKPARSGPRASWSGILRFGLVAFPVEAINAFQREGSSVAFHQLHASCHSRIRYEKRCPIHGPVDNSEIISGYEYAKGQYVEIEPEELDELRTDKEKALTVETFISPEDVDPIYFDGRMYYLIPDGDQAREPYAIFLAALKRKKKYGIGQVVFSGKEQVVVLRPYEDALHMAMLNFAAEIRDSQEIVGPPLSMRGEDKKVRLAEHLIESWAQDKFDFTEYADHYAEKVRELIEAKVKGKKIVVPEIAEEEPEVINLMEALRKSVGKGGRAKATSRKETKHVARPRRATTAHRRQA